MPLCGIRKAFGTVSAILPLCTAKACGGGLCGGNSLEAQWLHLTKADLCDDGSDRSTLRC